MIFERARALADAVMMEGYALYPYRKSATKNRYRWTFGVLAPRAWSEYGGCEAWWLEAQIAGTGRVHGQLRFFEVDRRDGWDEGIVRTFPFGEGDYDIATPRLSGRITVTRSSLVPPYDRITIRIENLTPWHDLGASRHDAVASAFAATHLLVATDGELLSAVDPPDWARPACRSVRTYPVLVGGSDLMLCAPFILQDNPQIAPESAGDMCDGGEIDELLLLRTRTLTDAEKREARATDARTKAIVDRADALPIETLVELHGTRRDIRAGEMVPKVGIGSKVRLRLPSRPTDAQDILYAGHVATVVEIKHDVDGTVFYAVTIDDDPAAELHDWYGRYHYYRDDEIEAP